MKPATGDSQVGKQKDQNAIRGPYPLGIRGGGFPVAYAFNDDVTLLLTQLAEGDQSVIPRLVPVVYDEL